MTVAEAAAELGLSIRGVLYRLEAGHMAGVKVNPRLWLVAREEVEQWKRRGRMPKGRKPRKQG